MSGQGANETPALTEQLYRSAELRALTILDAGGRIRHDLDQILLPDDLTLLSTAMRERERRAVRMRSLPPELFSDAGWAIMLELFIAEQQASTIPVSGNADRWKLSEATAARHIASLIASNLVMRVFGKTHDEAVTLRLTGHGRDNLKRVLAELS